MSLTGFFVAYEGIERCEPGQLAKCCDTAFNSLLVLILQAASRRRNTSERESERVSIHQQLQLYRARIMTSLQRVHNDDQQSNPSSSHNITCSAPPMLQSNLSFHGSLFTQRWHPQLVATCASLSPHCAFFQAVSLRRLSATLLITVSSVPPGLRIT